MARSEFDTSQALYQAIKKTNLGQANQGAAGHIEGLGQLTAQYDADMFFQAVRHDPYVFTDNASNKKYKEDNPEVIVTKW